MPVTDDDLREIYASKISRHPIPIDDLVQMRHAALLRYSDAGEPFGVYRIHKGEPFTERAVVVATIGGRGPVVGFVRLGMMWVHPKDRGQGLASALLTRQIRERGGLEAHRRHSVSMTPGGEAVIKRVIENLRR